MRVVLCHSHSIDEYDTLKILHRLGHEVFSIGGYIDPAAPHDPKRPALPEIPAFPVLRAAVDGIGSEDNLGAAQSLIPEPILEWADCIIFGAYLTRLFSQWEHLRPWRAAGGRTIWRTIGQSTENNEHEAASFRAEGLEIIRYSPKERSIPGFAGEDALIRFGKDPADWQGWTGEPPNDYEDPFVANVTQCLSGRHPWTNATFYLAATEGLNAWPAGPGSELLPGGLGTLSYEGMQQYLRDARCYLYTGTQPASYTLGLIEALMTGVPVVSIGPAHMQIFPYGPELFEGHELAPFAYEDPAKARGTLQAFLDSPDIAARLSQHQRWRAIQEFGIEAVSSQWRAYLGT